MTADPFLSPRSATGSLVRGRGGFWRRGNYDGPPMITDPDGATLKSGDRKGEIKRHAYASASGFGNLIEDMSWTAGLTDHTAADRGTFIHKIILEHVERGLAFTEIVDPALGISHDLLERIVTAWKLMLAENGLVVDVTEQAVVNDELRAAGTIDLICHSLKPLFGGAIPIGAHVVGDIKTGQTRQAHAAQLYVGATSVPYDTDTETRSAWPWQIDGTVALLFSLNLKDAIAGAPVVWTPILVDLVRTEFNCIDVICRAKAWAKDAAVFTPGEPTTLKAVKCRTCNGDGMIVTHLDDPPFPCPDCSKDRAPTVAHAEVEPTSPGTALPSPTPGQGLTPQQQHAAVPQPDEGGMWGNDNTWDQLAARYKALEPHQIAWIKQLTEDAQTAGVAFHAKGHRTRRRHNLYTAIIGYSEHIEPDDELLRALIAAVVDNDWPLFPVVTVGQAFGALNADEASTLSYVIQSFVAEGFTVHHDRGVMEIKAAA